MISIMSTANQQLDPTFVEAWGARFRDAWNDHGPEAIVALCTEDIVWNDAALPGPAHGRQKVLDFAEFTFSTFPDFRVEVTDALYISPIEPLALCPYRMSGTMPGAPTSTTTEASFRVNGIDQWTFRDELLCHYVTYYDYAEMIRQLGIQTSPEGLSIT